MRYEFSFQSERVLSSKFTLSDTRLCDGGSFLVFNLLGPFRKSDVRTENLSHF